MPLLVAVATFLLAAVATALRAEDYAISSFAGAANVITGADGTPGSFNNPYGVAIDSAKNIYVTDTVNHTIRKITPGRVVSTLAGTAGQRGAADGTGAAARFASPIGIGVDSAGNVYVADSQNFTIRKITAAGVVSTFAGTPFQPGSADGTGAAARFLLPYGIAVDSAGNVYVADSGNHIIRKITPAGVVTTLAGTAQQAGFADGTGGAARFQMPFGLSVDGSGNVYVADSQNHAIRRVTAAGAVSTVAGSPANSGSLDGSVGIARFDTPRGVAVDGSGNLFVADSGKSIIRHIAGGVVSTVAGSPGIVGETNSVGSSARFYDPFGIVADGSTFYVADTSNNQIRRGQPASQTALPVISIQPFDQVVSEGQSVSFTVVASGTSLSYQWFKSGELIVDATGATYTIPAAGPNDVASYVVSVSSAGGPGVPSSPGNLSVSPVSNGGPIAITARPLSQNVNPGQSATFSVTASGAGLSYQWLKDGSLIGGATNPSYTIGSAQSGDAATYTVRLTSGGSTETASAKLTVGGVAGGISITTQPISRSVEAGQSVSFSVVPAGATSFTFQWLKNESPIPGATSSNYAITSVQTSDAGSYTVRVSANGQNVVSSAATLTVTGGGPGPGPGGPTARLSNLSVRTTLGTGQLLIVGTTVAGGASNILVRAAGPALAAFGLSTAMVDPSLQLFNGPTVAFENNDWPSDLAATFASVGAFAFPANSRDAAFVRNIEGGRTIQVRGTGPGVVLVEAYDLGTGGGGRLTNVSARNFVGTGDDILIAGLVISGTGNKRLLIRAVGPTLATFGVGGTIADPKLEVYSGTTKLNENDNWTADLAPTFASVGAFALDANSRDAALIATLAPGNYTVQVSGVGGGTGEGLIEVYELP